MRQGILQELHGAARLTRGFFNSLIRRIECTKPIAGSGVSIEQKDDGIQISVSSEPNVYTLDICVNGTPSTLQVYGPADQ